jgi:hypothetical protein
VGCGLVGNETGSRKRQTLLLTPRAGPLPKSPSEVGENLRSSLVFRPHAIIATDRSVPSPIFVAALIGVEKILRINFDTSLPEATFVQQALAKLPEQTIAFGRPTGVTVNYAPDRAVRYDLADVLKRSQPTISLPFEMTKVSCNREVAIRTCTPTVLIQAGCFAMPGLVKRTLLLTFGQWL